MRSNRLLRTLLFGSIFIVATACGNSGSTASNTTTNPVVEPAATVVELATSSLAEPQAPEATAIAQSTPETSATVGTQATAGEVNTTGMRTFTIVPEQSEASYEVQEKFLNRSLPNKAIGKTNAIEGEFQFTTNGQPTGKVSKITVDLRKLTSDEARRDNRIRQQWLESDKYPYAEFTSTDAQDLPAQYTEGQDVSFKLTGDMKIRDVTHPVTFDVKGKLDGDTVTGTATTLLMMKDYGFEPPTIAGMLTVDDGVTVVVNFTAKEAAN